MIRNGIVKAVLVFYRKADLQGFFLIFIGEISVRVCLCLNFLKKHDIMMVDKGLSIQKEKVIFGGN
jgi:hypothetical protein